jgi:DNA ligase-associated metallophosphoesterase
VWIPESRALAVADLHLGRAWSERRRGQLLPVDAPDDAPERLTELHRTLRPETLVILGDLVHEAVDIADIADRLCELLQSLATASRVILVRGNHDRALDRIAHRLPIEIADHCAVGPHLGIHGDTFPSHVEEHLKKHPDSWLFTGHEHPSVTLGDGVGTSVRCPCFVVGERRLILPAFSTWAAGCDVGRRPFLSGATRAHSWKRLVAIVGPRCLPLPFP